MPNFVYLNNKCVNFKDAKIHIEDRGFQFSDSVYEVIKVLNNKIIDIDFHISRLKYSTTELNFNIRINKNLLTKIFISIVKKNKLSAEIKLPGNRARKVCRRVSVYQSNV